MQVGQLKKCVLRVLEIVFAKRDMVEKDVMNVWLVGLDIQIVNHVEITLPPFPVFEPISDQQFIKNLNRKKKRFVPSPVIVLSETTL